VTFQAGDIVTISYTGYVVDAKVIDPPDSSGWVNVEQITDFEDRPEGERPVYLAAVEYCVPKGDPPAPGPWSWL
jgi:FKBP-type peptidyl-prolyl cis-trans isomerase 2